MTMQTQILKPCMASVHLAEDLKLGMKKVDDRCRAVLGEELAFQILIHA